MPLRLVEYNPGKSFAIYGDTKLYIDEFTKLEGKFNGKLREGAGWIFKHAKYAELKALVEKYNKTPRTAPVEKTIEKPIEKTPEAKSTKTVEKTPEKIAKPPQKNVKSKSTLEKFEELLQEFSTDELAAVIQQASNELLERFNTLSVPSATKTEASDTDEVEDDNIEDDEVEEDEEETSDLSDDEVITPLKF